MLQDNIGSRDQFIADVAIKLERLRVTLSGITDAISDWRDQHTALKERVDLVLDDRCCEIEKRLSEHQQAIDALSAREHQLEREIRAIKELRSDIALLSRRLSDPTRGVSYATSEVMSKLGQRLEIVEQYARSAIRVRRRVKALATIAVVAVTVGILSDATQLRRISSALGAWFATSAEARCPPSIACPPAGEQLSSTQYWPRPVQKGTR